MKEKLSNLLIDVGKYILTAVVITSLFAELEGDDATLYLAAGITVAAILSTGLLLTPKKEK